MEDDDNDFDVRRSLSHRKANQQNSPNATLE
jgi:hypothetical protein